MSLGVITGKEVPDLEKLDRLFEDLYKVFDQEKPAKEEVVKVMQAYLPNFAHIETGKSLDSKM